MAEEVPLPRENTSEDDPPPDPGERTPRSNGGRSTGRRSDASTGRDPWARRDPWSVPRSQAAEVRAPGLESEFLQFLQWRAQASAVDQGLYQGHQEGSNRALWQAAREEHERTTAGPPPEWDGISTEFRDYKLKAKIWLRTTRTPAHARGPLLLKNLSKGPWEDLKFLASDEDWLTDPTNGTKLLELMDSKEYYGEEQRESMLAACSRLTFHLKRQRGESARQFMTRWDTAERKVREHEVRLPQDFLGFLMVNALQLDSERTKLLLNYTKGSLKVSDVKEWLRIHETDLDLSTLGNDKKKSTAYFLDQENAKEIQLMDIPESDEDMETESSELLLTALADLEDSDNLAESNAVTLSEAETKEILLTMVKDHKAKSRSYAGAMKAKKNRDLARGFGAGRDGILRPGTYEVSISELKKRTKCNACGQTGHWARECPSKGKKPSESSHVKGDAMKPKTKELNFLQNSAGLSAESEFFYLESMGSTEPTNAQSNCGWDAPGFCDEQDDSAISELVTERAYMERPTIFQCFHMQVSMDEGCATLDTGCQRMAIGLNTLQKLQLTQPSELPVTFYKEIHHFRSVHQTSCTTQLACIPCSLGPRGCILRPALFEEASCADAPFLLSLPFLLHCKAILCLDEQHGLKLVSKQFGFSVACHLGPTGALRIPIQQFTTEMISFLSQRIPKSSDEYELLQTNLVDEPGSQSNLASSSCDKSPAHGAAPRTTNCNARRSFQEGSDRSGQQIRSAMLDSPGPQDDDDHSACHRAQGVHALQDARTTWPFATPDGGDGWIAGARADGSTGPSYHHDEFKSNVPEALSSQVFHTVGMVQGDRLRSTAEDPTKEFKYEESGVPHRLPVHSGPSSSNYVGDPAGSTSDSGCSEVHMRPSMPSLGIQDREESRSSLLEMQSTQSPTVCLFHVAEQPDPEVPRCGSSTGGTTHGTRGDELLHETTSGGLPTQEIESSGYQCLSPEGDNPGLRQGGDGATKTTHCSDQERGQSTDQQPISIFHDFNVVSGAQHDAVHPARQLEQPAPVPGGVSGLSQLEASEGGSREQFSKSTSEPTTSEVKAGLRRHIYGCLKRSEQCWLEIFRLLCDHSECDDETQLQTTCKVIRSALQEQQPHMKFLSELYMLQPKQLRTVAEVCNPNRFGSSTDYFGLRSGQAFDLELGWDLLDVGNQQRVISYLKSERPGLVVISPPCTKFSSLLNLCWPIWSKDPKKFDQHVKELRKAIRLLQFCTKICLLCHSLGLSFVFERPWSASSWNEPCLQRLIQHDDFLLARVDQCMFGLTTTQGEPMRKRSGFLTNSLHIAQQLNSTCDGSHSHELVMGRDRGAPMNRSRLAQRYPAGLVNAILIAYASSIGLGHHLLYLVEGNAVFEKEKSLENNLILCGDLCPEGQLSTACRSADGNPPELPRPGLLAEVHPLDEPEEKEKFPGTHPLSLEALVKRAHEGLGHPGKDRFIRILTNSKASPKVLEIAKNLKCSVCEKFKLPRPSRAAAPPKDIGLNEIVGVDTIQLRASFSEKTKYCINIIDYSSHFQLIVPLTAHTAEATRAGYRLWLKIFGPPRKLLCDLGREFQKQFETLAEADGSELIPSSLETPEQRGFVERHGQLFKEVFYKTIEQTKCSTWDEWYQTIDLACSTKNRLLSRGGFSPAQRVFVFQQRIPGGLMSEGESDLAVQSLAATGDVNVSRSMMIRKAAAQSFHEVDCQQAIRAAATHGPRPHYAYETGQAVYFWRRATDAARKPASYFWHGPARVVATQLPTTVWLSYNHHLVKAAPEKLRPASEEEFFSISGWLEGISNAKKQFEASKVKGLIDLSQENDELPPAELHDFWRQEGNFWIRVHVQPRRELFHPEERGQDPPVPPSHLRPWRRSVMNITDGDQEILEDDWTSGNGIPAHRQEWTGETWLEEKIDEPSRLEQKREADPLVPRSRLSKKSRVEPEQMIPFSQAPMATPETALETPEPIPVMPGAPPGLPAPDPPLPEVPLPDPPEVEPQQETRPLDDNHQHPEERKREFVEVDQPDADWSSLPVSKRSRLELLEIYYQEISNKSAQRQKKGKEATLRDFQGKDRERLLRAIHKEFNNNLATGAYEVLTPQESARIRASSPEKIMKSRYVLTKKPIEDCGLEDAISADEILDSSEKDQPCKAKCRHVMQGYSESALLDLETSTPQVHRDSVIFAAQIMASKHWTPGFADFTQAFHSGDPIDRELYAEQPAEGLPGASKGQLLKLKKTCYGLTDGPYAWFKHIVTFLCEQLGYRQSVVDQCLFFLDSEPDAEGKSSIEGIIALATDDLFHGGSQRHFQLMEIIRSKYKLGKYTWGQGRFVGKDIRQLEDFSILVDQQFYTEARVAPIPLQRERKRRRFSVCNPEETEQLRALVGTLSWLSKETRCDLAGKTALLQQAFPRPMIRDIITANQIAQEALDHKHLGIRAMSIPLDRLHAGVVTDASWGNSKEFGTYLEAGTTKDRWEETSTSWIRHHVDPRITAFHPAACPDGPDLHDLRPERSTEIRTGSRSTTFQDDWTTSDSLRSMSSSTWTGTTTFYKQDEGKSLDSKAIHAGYDQLNKLFSQGGEIVIFYDQDLPKSQTLQNVSLASWKSYRLKRRTVNTLSSETQALVRGLSSVHWYRVLILEAKGLHLSAREWHREVAQLPFICVTDSKSLYDTICKCTNPASQCEDKRTSIDISLIKQEIAELNGNIRWIDGRTMLADSLTKESKADLLRHVMNTGQWSILEEGSALQRKLLERTSKHEVLFIF